MDAEMRAAVEWAELRTEAPLRRLAEAVRAADTHLMFETSESRKALDAALNGGGDATPARKA